MSAIFGTVNVIASRQAVAEMQEEINSINEKNISQDRAIDTKVDKVEGMGLSQNSYTNEEKTKLSGIDDGAEANVQSDWDETGVTKDEYIQNKPNAMTSSEIQNIINNLN